jgi:hypothetical protein
MQVKIYVIFSCIMTSYSLVGDTYVSLWVGEDAYGIQNHCVFGLPPSSAILETFRKLELFPSSGEEVETPTLLGPLERAITI